jgi:N-acetylmuramoyl-L-alanine amidase
MRLDVRVGLMLALWGLSALAASAGLSNALARDTGVAAAMSAPHDGIPAKVVDFRAMRLADSGSVHAKGASKSANPIHASGAALIGTKSNTVFSLDLSAGVQVEIFTLAEPYRVVVDLPHVTFRLPKGVGQSGRGLVKAFRYGLLDVGKARVVIDTDGPVVIGKAAMAPRGGGTVRLTIALQPTTEKAFGAGTGGERAARKKSAAAERVPTTKKKRRSKPVVLIDAGHGGVDPGAMSPSNVPEKKVVLAVAKKLERHLKKTGHYTVHMTRTRDVFISLDRRVKMSRKLDADLFISLHADAIARKHAKRVRGATVYTLSEKASDEEARLMAEKENASDAIAGLAASELEEQDQVRDILIDLLKRETANFSAEFSNTLVKRLGKTISLSRVPQRSAAFKVLRQADTPSVLVELGYMSNAKDEKLLNSANWQRRIASTIGSAVDSYFAKRTAKAP